MSPSKRSLGRLLGGLRGSIARFPAASGGMAATEFAIIAPVMVILYFGLVEYTLAYDARSKATAVASTAADLVAQEKDICDAEMTDAFTALAAIMYPFASADMQVRVSSLIDDGDGGAKVAWSDGHNMTPRTVDEPVEIPTGLVSEDGSVIMSEITYSYDSPTSYFITYGITMSDTFYVHPRKAAQVTRTASCS
jgi:Flp pilus assembly protein TadG